MNLVSCVCCDGWSGFVGRDDVWVVASRVPGPVRPNDSSIFIVLAAFYAARGKGNGRAGPVSGLGFWITFTS
jgi:hypothetical protein